MTISNPTPAAGSAPPAASDELRPTLDRIASALEKSNEQAAKKDEGGDKKEGGEDKEDGGKKEGGDDKKEGGDKKDGQGKDGKDVKKKKSFLLSPLGILLILVVLTAAVIGTLSFLHYARTHVTTDDAYTAAHVHQVGPRVAGTVLEVWVDDNQVVKEGDLLVKLDPRDSEVALQRAQADLDQSKAQILQAEAAVIQAKAGVTQAQAQVAQARAQTDQAGAQYQVAGVNYGRNSALFSKDGRAVSRSDVDTTKSALDANQAGFNAAKSNVQAAEANVEAAKAVAQSREAEIIVSKAMVATNEANVANAKLQLSYCWVLAPCAGRVSRKTVEVGARLSIGQALLAVTENNVWVLANLKETQLQNVRVGQRVRLPLDAFKGQPFTGRVDSIQAGSGATYSLLPPDNATGNFTKIVQRVPVKITFDSDSVKGFEDLIVAGLSVVPVIDLQSASDRGDHVTKDNPAPAKGPHQK